MRQIKIIILLGLSLSIWLSTRSQSLSPRSSLHFSESFLPYSLDPSQVFIGLGGERELRQIRSFVVAAHASLLFRQSIGTDSYGSFPLYQGGLMGELRSYYLWEKHPRIQAYANLGGVAGYFGSRRCENGGCTDESILRLIPYLGLGLRVYPFGERLYGEIDLHSSFQLNLRIGITLRSPDR